MGHLQIIRNPRDDDRIATQHKSDAYEYVQSDALKSDMPSRAAESVDQDGMATPAYVSATG